MANIVIAKKDMAGRVMIGEGWLVCHGFAVRVGEDPRFVSCETARAAFKDFHPEELDDETYEDLHAMFDGRKAGQRFTRTRILMEDQESGDLLRAYRNAEVQAFHLVSERRLQVLGKPEFVFVGAGQDVIVVEGKGLIALTTEVIPSWAEALAVTCPGFIDPDNATRHACGDDDCKDCRP